MSNLIDAQKRATKLLKDFNDELLLCKNENDYFSLVSSVFIYCRLIENHFCDFYGEKDATESLTYLQKTANTIADSIAAESIMVENQNQSNTKLN